MHGVSYLIATALTVDRRHHQREMLGYYRDRLCALGVSNPGSLDLSTEYRRSMIWGFYVGLLTTPVVNHGWELTIMAHLRMMTAYEDLGSP